MKSSDKQTQKWAKVMKDILSSDKPKSKNYVVLSKAEKPEPENENSEDETADEIAAKINLKKEWIARGRCKPNPSAEGERERKLRRLAVCGVVQLFNAVGKHQSDSTAMSNSASVQSIKPLDKSSFYNMLLGKNESIKDEDRLTVYDDIKEESALDEQEKVDSQESSKWDVLRDNFMMSVKLKDWDRSVDP